MRILVSLILLVAGTAFAGEGSTSVKDGGHGILCRHPVQELRIPMRIFDYNLELLDFYEAHRTTKSIFTSNYDMFDDEIDSKFFSRRVCKELRNRKEELEQAIGVSKISPAFDDACKLTTRVRFQKALSRSNDQGKFFTRLERKCVLVQIALRTVVNGQEQIVIDSSLANLLTFTEMAGLMLHESLHKYYPEKDNTQIIRQLVLFSFSDSIFLNRNGELVSRVIQSGTPAPRLNFKSRTRQSY